MTTAPFRHDPALRLHLHLLTSLQHQLHAELLHAVIAAHAHGYTPGQIAVLPRPQQRLTANTDPRPQPTGNHHPAGPGRPRPTPHPSNGVATRGWLIADTSAVDTGAA